MPWRTPLPKVGTALKFVRLKTSSDLRSVTGRQSLVAALKPTRFLQNGQASSVKEHGSRHIGSWVQKAGMANKSELSFGSNEDPVVDSFCLVPLRFEQKTMTLL